MGVFLLLKFKIMITKLVYNWHQNGDTESGMGEDYNTAEVGKKHITNDIVKETIEHRAYGEGDKLFYDVIFDNGTELRVFNPNYTIRTK